MKEKLKKKKGMTLIEIIISMMIITIMLIPILSLVVNSVKTNKAGEDKQKATLAGQQVFENIKSDIVLNGLTIYSNSPNIDIRGMTLQKYGDEYKTSDDGADYTINGEQYKVKIAMKKNEELQSSASSEDYDAQYEVSGQNGSFVATLVKYGDKVTGNINASGSITEKKINIEQNENKTQIKVCNSVVINSKDSSKINGKILFDFSKVKFDDSEADKKIIINVNNSSVEDLNIYTQKLNGANFNVEVETDAASKGTIKTYAKDIEDSYINGVSEPWNINIKVFKVGSSSQIFSGDIIQNIKTN